MTNEITTLQFNSDQFGQLRAIQDESGEPWFVAKDVCDALGLGRQQDSTRHLDQDERGECLVDTPSGKQTMVVINEPGFYKLIMKSRKPEAKAFQRWVTHEVLPSIRKKGGYIAAAPDETPEQIMARAVLLAQDTIERQKAQIEELKPKALFADAVAASDGTCLIGAFAKVLQQNGINIGQNRLFAWMRENGYLGKSGSNHNIPTQRYVEMGLFRTKKRQSSTQTGA